MNIEGTWLSQYEYQRGQEEEQRISRHRLHFAPTDGGWVGETTSSPDGSNLTLTLHEAEDGSIAGEWREQTGKEGHYGGDEFGGIALFSMTDSADELHGMWLGKSSSGHIKAGAWILNRGTDDSQ